MKKVIKLTENNLNNIIGKCIEQLLLETTDESGFSVIRYGQRGRGGKTKYNTVWDETDDNGNLFLDLNKIKDPVKRKEIYQKLMNGELAPSQVKVDGFTPVDNGIDLDTRTNISPTQKDFHKYTSGTGTNKYKVLSFVK